VNRKGNNMKLEITTVHEPIDVLGQFDPVKFEDNRKVFIDGKRASPKIEALILSGLDHETSDYLDDMEKEMRKRGYL
jgi:hypothetical protein